jgi:hemoglobin
MTRFAFCLALALLAGHAAAQTAKTDDSLYKAFGEKAGLTSLMDDFVDRLARDARTERFFRNADHPRLKAQLTDQLCMLAGGPCQYAGRDMKSAHTGMGVDKAHFNGLVEVLQEAMDAKRIPFTQQNRMLALLAPMHRDIITK